MGFSCLTTKNSSLFRALYLIIKFSHDCKGHYDVR